MNITVLVMSPVYLIKIMKNILFWWFNFLNKNRKEIENRKYIHAERTIRKMVHIKI